MASEHPIDYGVDPEHAGRRRRFRGLERGFVYTPEVEERIMALRLTMSQREVAAAIGATLPSLKHWAKVHRVRFPRRKVFTDGRAARVRALAGKVPAAALAAEVGVGLSSLRGWASTAKVPLALPRSPSPRAAYVRIKQAARRLGFRLMTQRSGRLSLWVSVREGMSPAECERFLSHANRRQRFRAVEAAYSGRTA